MTITIRNTYGRPHPTSDGNPAHVTGAPGYRVSMTAILPATEPRFNDMITYLTEGAQNLHSRPEGYGLIFLESEEHSATYFGSMQQVADFQREQQTNPGASFDGDQGFFAAQWPHGKGWDDFLPPAYWNMAQVGAIADGVGLVTAFAHTEAPSAEVTVYEFEGKWLADSEPTQMVTYHCTACHLDTFHDSGHVHANTGPQDRRWAARQARQHILSAHRHGVGNENSACRPNGGEMLRVVNAVAKERLGLSGNALPDTEDAYCATKGPCAVIRELRAGVRPAPYGR
jgi:hypothetical protein